MNRARRLAPLLILSLALAACPPAQRPDRAADTLNEILAAEEYGEGIAREAGTARGAQPPRIDAGAYEKILAAGTLLDEAWRRADRSLINSSPTLDADVQAMRLARAELGATWRAYGPQ